MSEISIPPIRMLDVSLLSIDGNNPNKMNDSQFEALKENIKRFGFNVPIITDENLVISDGEHRFRAAKELGMDSVPVIVLPVSEHERLILRQVMNKLKGRHNISLDFEEYKRIFSTAFEEYGLLLGLNRAELDSLLDSVNRTNSLSKDPLLKNTVDAYLVGFIKQMSFHFTNEEFLDFYPRLQKALEHSGKSDTSSFFVMLLEDYESDNGLVS